jgi:hypothetical protein
MEHKAKEFTTITLEDGTFGVARADASRRPHFLELIATFYDAARAQDYARIIGNQPDREARETAPRKRAAEPDLSFRQRAVLDTLRAKMNKDRFVEARAATLAPAAKIRLGSVYAALASLENKGLIRTNRQGTSRSPAVYQVEDTKESGNWATPTGAPGKRLQPAPLRKIA